MGRRFARLLARSRLHSAIRLQGSAFNLPRKLEADPSGWTLPHLVACKSNRRFSLPVPRREIVYEAGNTAR